MPNTRNVDAILKVITEGGNDASDEHGLQRPFYAGWREVAEYLASRGCLGPASQVLTLGEMSDVMDQCTIFDRWDNFEKSDPKTLIELLERIARGEIP